MDAGRQHEECDRQRGQRDQQQPPVIECDPDGASGQIVVDDQVGGPGTPGDERADRHDDRQEQAGPHVHGRDPGDQRRRLPGLRPGHVPEPQPVRGQAVAVLGQQCPGVVGVDRDVRVAAGRLDDLLEQSDDRQAERQAQADSRRQPDDRACHQPDGTLAKSIQQRLAARPCRWLQGHGSGRCRSSGEGRVAIRPRSAESIPYVATEQDEGQDRDQDPELWLDHRRDDGEQGRPFWPATPQVAQGQEQEDHAERIDLTPDRAIEPGHRVDQDQDRPDPRRPTRPPELDDEAVDQPGQDDVGQDRRQLDQVADPADGVPDDPDQPQDVQVARGVVDERDPAVEAQRAVGGEIAGPCLERSAVGAEAGTGQQDVCDDEAEGEPDGQDQEERPGGLERPRRRPGASVGRTGSGGCQGGPPPARALRWSGV